MCSKSLEVCGELIGQDETIWFVVGNGQLAVLFADEDSLLSMARQIQKSAEASEVAASASLRYVSDRDPGIRRIAAGKGFIYCDLQGRRIRDPLILHRIGNLVIPPAWNDVWICPLANGHLQATGRDERGRKQYIYHPRWRAVRDEAKFGRLPAFARALPKLRRRVQRDLALPGLARAKILAMIVRLLESTFIRIGNEEYVRSNGSFGLTTLRNHHAKVSGDTTVFHFRGKSGKLRTVSIDDSRIARIVKRCQELPGHELFEYVDEGGQIQRVSSEDVNDYIREAAGAEFSAKDFRTWGGTLLAAELLRNRSSRQQKTKQAVVDTVRAVAQRLGNTASVCRKCYIHPMIFERFAAGSFSSALGAKGSDARLRNGRALRASEAAVLRLLSRQPRRNEAQPK